MSEDINDKTESDATDEELNEATGGMSIGVNLGGNLAFPPGTFGDGQPGPQQ